MAVCLPLPAPGGTGKPEVVPLKTTSEQVLVVDDEPQICEMILDGLALQGFSCKAVNEGLQAKQLLRDGSFAVLVTDVAMPGISGLDLLAHVRSSLPHCKVILVTGVPGADLIADALTLGAYDYLPKPVDMDQLIQSVGRALGDTSSYQYLPRRAAKAIEMESRVLQASLESIRALAQAVEAKDPYTRRHSEQVAHYAVHLGAHMKAEPAALESLRIAALLHDIGKIGTPDHILTKAGELTKEEFSLIRQHPLLGSEILEHISMFAKEARLVRHHHENWDGAGYPDGLAGEAIPWGARVINVADSMDAMLMKRTYKAAYPVTKMLSELEACAGKQFDPTIATAAIEWCNSRPEELILPH